MPTRWLEQHAPTLIGALGLSLIAAFALIGLLFVRLEQTRNDLDRVEAGALVATVRVETFRKELVAIGPGVVRGFDQALADIEAFRASSIDFDVTIDETVPIDAGFAIDREFVVPIETTIPIAQTIETTIQVRGPLGLAVPVDVTVPIELEVPVNLDLTFAVQETISVKTDVPVRFDLPISIDVADTGFADLGDSLAAGLTGLRQLFAGLEE